MNEDDQRQGADESQENAPAQALFAPYAPEGSWENILTLLEISPDALVLIDADGRIMSVNSQAEEMFGYACSELKGEMLEILLPERFHAIHEHHRERYATVPHTRPMGTGLELYGRRKDGTEFAVDVSLSPLLFNGALYMLGAVRDVTMRQQMKEHERVVHETAEARLALLQLVLDELPTCVYFVTGSEARLVLANQAAATLWGATWPAGQPMLEFLSTHSIRVYDMNGQVVEPTALATMRVLQEGQTVFQHQEIIRHADGTSLPILVNAVVVDPNMLTALETGVENVHISSAEPAALVVLHDVSSLKEVEHLKEQLIWLVAHELRNPLAALKGFATMLLRHSHGDKGMPLVSWQKEAFTEIDLATDRLNRLTEDLLDVVRLQTGKLVLHREPVDLVDTMRHVVAQMEQSSEQHRLAFSASFSHLQAQVDRGRIEQVLVNLLTNAIKYSPDGGLIEMTLQQVPGQQEALITIRDQGIGIPEAEQAQLFGRFSRASNGESQGISGTGLGLYLCHELVSQHGGDIWFESTEGVGSTFFLRLPLLAGASRHDAMESSSSLRGEQ
jgi:PAS domain S-box-containing protein